jgi:ABC-type transport system substrate-binding protein
MRSLGNFKANSSKYPITKERLRGILALGIAFVVLAAVACGSAAAPETSAPDSAAPVGAEPTAVPTVVAQAVQSPAEVTVHPGKVTWMIGSFGNERFDYTFNTAGHDYARQIHGFLISSDVDGGRRVLVPGIASKWEVSSDGLTWTLTIREGVNSTTERP